MSKRATLPLPHLSNLFLTALFLLVVSANAQAADTPTFEVLAYDIRLHPDLVAKTVSGSERIRFISAIDGLRGISFSASSLEVVASIDDKVIANRIENGRRIFELPKPLKKSETGTLVVSFKGPAPKGLVFGEDTVYANYFTCDAVICDQDRPGDKAPVDFELTVPRGMDVVAPGTLLNHGRAGDLEFWGFRETRPTSPHLIGFAAGRYARIPLPGSNPELDILASPQTSADQVTAMFADTRRMLKFFEEKSGVRYDAPIYTQVLIDGSEAQEVARHSVIGTDEIKPILADPHEDWVIAHELAHQWWGNSVTCADWSELWLNEGVTVFMVAAYKEQRWGRAAYDHELELANKRWQAAKDQGFDVPLSWQGQYPSLRLKRAMAYAKAVVFLAELRAELGDETFWRAIRDYTRRHKDGVVTAIDLERAFERASHKDLSPLFAEWVFGTPSSATSEPSR